MKRAVMLAGVFLFMASPAMANNHEIKQKMPNLSGIGIGKKLYDENCASCHGVSMKGTNQGPAFLHRVYHPNHHGDAAILLCNAVSAAITGGSAICRPSRGCAGAWSHRS